MDRLQKHTERRETRKRIRRLDFVVSVESRLAARGLKQITHHVKVTQKPPSVFLFHVRNVFLYNAVSWMRFTPSGTTLGFCIIRLVSVLKCYTVFLYFECKCVIQSVCTILSL